MVETEHSPFNINVRPALLVGSTSHFAIRLREVLVQDQQADVMQESADVRRLLLHGVHRSDGMADGDLGFFYHSNTDVPGIVGIVKIVGDVRPDPTQFHPDSKYYDPKSTTDNPRWLLRDVQAVRPLKRKITLAELKERAEELGDFPLVRRGNRLSIMPVEKQHWDFILALEDC